MPTFYDICYRDLKLLYELYFSIQCMGSHAVHGTWTDLKLHYLKQENDEFILRDHDVVPHENLFTFTPLNIIMALNSFIDYIFTDIQIIDAFRMVLNGIQEEIIKIERISAESDFKIIKNC